MDERMAPGSTSVAETVFITAPASKVNQEQADAYIQAQIDFLNQQLKEEQEAKDKTLERLKSIEAKLQPFLLAEQSDSSKETGVRIWDLPRSKQVLLLNVSQPDGSEKEELSDSSSAASAPRPGQRLPSDSNGKTQRSSTKTSGPNFTQKARETSSASAEPPKGSTPQTDQSTTKSRAASSANKDSTSQRVVRFASPLTRTSVSEKSTSGLNTVAAQSATSAQTEKAAKQPAELVYPTNATLSKLKLSKKKFAQMPKAMREVILASEASPKK